jgi:hypothetical protein
MAALVIAMWRQQGRPGIMNTNASENGDEGQITKLASAQIKDRMLIVAGRWIKIATVKDEELIEGTVVKEPESFVRELRQSRLKADIFNFPHKHSDGPRTYAGYFEEDNLAAIPLTSFDAWWNGLSQDTRRNVRKAGKQGVAVKVVKFDDEFARGIKAIYDETPIRQGRRFWHYQKDLETIQRETSTYIERSEFIGAYHQSELIGFIKMVYTDRNAHIIHFLSKNASYELRPANALVSKAVEICTQRNLAHLVYRKYVYGNSGESSLTEFKRRNGFEEIRYPRYFIGLTAKGRLAVSLGMHHGVKGMLPQKLVGALRGLRAYLLEILARQNASRKVQSV